jgi:hypothetical protein
LTRRANSGELRARHMSGMACSDTGEHDMCAQTALFSRRYRAALLDYLLGGGEAGLARAYDLGRTAIDEGLGLLAILRAHREAVDAVLQSTLTVNDSLTTLAAAEDFLMEILSPFEMIYRGYVGLLEGGDAHGRQRPSRRRRNAGRHR